MSSNIERTYCKHCFGVNMVTMNGRDLPEHKWSLVDVTEDECCACDEMSDTIKRGRGRPKNSTSFTLVSLEDLMTMVENGEVPRTLRVPISTKFANTQNWTGTNLKASDIHKATPSRKTKAAEPVTEPAVSEKSTPDF